MIKEKEKTQEETELDLNYLESGEYTYDDLEGEIKEKTYKYDYDAIAEALKNNKLYVIQGVKARNSQRFIKILKDKYSIEAKALLLKSGQFALAKKVR